MVSENHPISISSFPVTKAPEAVSELDNLAHICTKFVSFPPDQVYPYNWLRVKPNYIFLNHRRFLSTNHNFFLKSAAINEADNLVHL